MRPVVFGLWVAVIGAVFGTFPGHAAGQLLNLDGVWFGCEFAHSQIAPDDKCLMLDDDGFVISGQKINHIKVLDSEEPGCRQNRKGNCFRRDRERVKVEQDSAGDFRLTEVGFQIDYWGCSQDYKLNQHETFFEITPVDGLCYWASDKRYFLARYFGDLEVADDITDETAFSSDR